MNDLRIVSLIPSATEIVYSLGLGDFLVARSHDSNYPKEALAKPVISSATIPDNLTSREIDNAVKQSIHKGTSLFHLDQKMLTGLKPNLILTQELCAVCAPNFTQVKKECRILDGSFKLLSLEPSSIADVLENIITVGEYSGFKPKALDTVHRLQNELEEIKAKAKTLQKKSVIIVEWLDPIMIAGHWVPEMVDCAGGKMLLSKLHEKSRYAEWQEIVKADPDVLIFAPCGFDITRAMSEYNLFTAKPEWKSMRAVKNKQVYFVDGDAYLTRSGPRLVEGTKILSKIIHPEVFGKPKPIAAVQL